MLSNHKERIAILLVVVTVASGITGVVGGQALADTPASVSQPDEGTFSQAEKNVGESACAAEPPSDGSDPDSDVVGWEDGYWYDESLDVDQSDGLNDAERDAVVARTTARVEAVRCIEFEESVPVSVISRDELRERRFEEEVSPELRAFDNAKFEAMFLVGESNDSIEVQNENAAGSVLGYYSPTENEIVVVAENPDDLRIGELTLAHELMHAWQDQTYNLSSNDFDTRIRDEANANRGLVEGDASYTEKLYEQRCGEEWECLDEPGGPSGDLANFGIYALNFQPYSDGPEFVQLLRNVGGWDAVNAAYDRPPESAEQVIHPERYLSDPPTNVTIEDATTDEWERVNPPDRAGYGQVGESGLVAMFVYPYYHSEGETELVPVIDWLNFDESGAVDEFDPLNYRTNYTTGWDGDRLHVYRNDADELAYVWRMEWDSPQDAQQFAEGYRKVLNYWGGEQVGRNTYRIADGGFADAFHVEVDGTTVTVTNAPTVEQLPEVRTGVNVGDVETTTAEGVTLEIGADETTTTETDETTAETDGPAASATVQVEANETTAVETALSAWERG